jgi:hypothetical protein
MAYFRVAVGVLGGTGCLLWMKLNHEHEQYHLSRFLDNIDRRERIRPKLHQYASFTNDTPLEKKQSLIKEILAEYSHIDPAPLTKRVLVHFIYFVRERMSRNLTPRPL